MKIAEHYLKSNREPLKLSEEEGDEIRDTLGSSWKRRQEASLEGYFNNLINTGMVDCMSAVLQNFPFCTHLCFFYVYCFIQTQQSEVLRHSRYRLKGT